MATQEFHGIKASSQVDAFVIAASSGKLKEMRLLLNDGVNIEAVASYCQSTALAQAAGEGNHRGVSFLLEYGADADKPGAYDMTPLMHACSRGRATGSRVALLLLEANADVNYVRQSDEMTALKFAVNECNAEVIQGLIDRGAEIDGPKGTSQTALMIAARANNADALKILVEHGADIHLPCKLPWAENRTARGLAEMEKRRKAVAYLSSLT